MACTEFPVWPYYSEEEIHKVTTILTSGRVNYWTGTEAKQFEQEFAAKTNCQYAITLANGTLALETALHSLNIGNGDEVIVTPRTFIASASAIARAGAKPVFVDIDDNSQNITLKHIQPAVTTATKAIICVHLAGWPCEMDAITQFARQNNVYIIEDCAQAHGAYYKNQPLGSFGDIAAWSFCQDKIISTGGEGGMITTNNRVLWERAWSLKDHGKSHQKIYQNDSKPLAQFSWVHDSIGSNYRMTELQAAIGRIQLTKLSEWQQIRSRNANIILTQANYCSALTVPSIPKDILHAWYKCHIFINPAALKSNWNRARIIAEINEKGVPCFIGSCSEIYLEQALQPNYYTNHRLPSAQRLGETSLMFLVHPTLSSSHMEQTAEILLQVMAYATK